jgi:transposase
MASLTAKTVKGRKYYYLRECRRVDGKPKITKQVYLGSAAEVAAALADPARGFVPLPEAPVREFGALAALFDLASRIGFTDIVDAHVPKRSGKAPSVGAYLLLAALNRCVASTSKAGMKAWYETTSLPRWLPFAKGQISSQRFWDNMDRVDESALRAIETDFTRRIVKLFDLDLSCFFYDATNFYTFIDSFNDDSTLAQRGKSKEGRSNLRILGLALAVTADHHVPLFHHLYPGNQHDAPTLRSLLDDLARRHELLASGCEDITLVFDKGNNAEDIVEQLDDGPYHLVGSLVPTQHRDLLAIEPDKLMRLDPERFPAEVLSYRTSKRVYGREFTVLVTWNENLHTTQVQTLEREIAKRRAGLLKIQRRLARARRGPRRGRPATKASVQKAVQGVLQGRHMKDLFQVEVDRRGPAVPTMTFRFDHEAWRKLDRTLLGKTLLFTDRSDWSDEKIVEAYRGQHHVEAAFRQMKDPHHLAFRPTRHWTDQKLRVHTLYCVVAFAFATLLQREVASAGLEMSVPALLDELGGIREVQVLTASKSGRPRTHRIHSKLGPVQKRLYETLDLARYL